MDDDPDVVASLSALLTAHGFAVEGYTDPTTALDRVRFGPAPDLLLTDCLMPSLSGAELADAVAAAGVRVPVVLMTGLPDPGFCVDTGSRSVLNKPFLVEDLLAELAHPASRPGARGERSSPPVSGPRSTRPPQG